MYRIAITGPESTGKSWLSEQLAMHYKTVYAPEFAREYLYTLNRNYNFEDLTIIAQGQIENEKKASKKARKFLFCDTELTVIKIWAEHKYKQCPSWVSRHLPLIRYDLYLLCNIDLPWEFDPLREHPHLREYFFDWYQRELSQRNLPFAIISGTGQERLQNAIHVIDKMFGV